MSRYANEAHNLDLVREDDLFEATFTLHALRLENDVDAQFERHMNPLKLEPSDLTAVGWDLDVLGDSWFHCNHGVKSFLDATRIEADKVDLTVPEVF